MAFSDSGSSDEPDLSLTYRPFLLDLRLIREGCLDEVSRLRLLSQLKPEAICLTDEEWSIVKWLEEPKMEWEDGEQAGVIQEERRSRMLENARREVEMKGRQMKKVSEVGRPDFSRMDGTCGDEPVCSRLFLTGFDDFCTELCILFSGQLASTSRLC